MEYLPQPDKETQGAHSVSPAQPSATNDLPKKPWLKNKKKTEAGVSERVKKVPSKQLPPKPWPQKKSTVTASPAEESEITEENTTNLPEEEVEEVKVPSKGYNLDFLDNLDDPNLNPFQTKTAFDDLPPVVQPETIPPPPSAVETVSAEPKPSVEKEQKQKNEDVKPKKELPPKPWQKKAKKPAVKPAKEEATEDETKTEEVVRVPSKGYNLDYLDNLDDPISAPPLATKSALIQNKEFSLNLMANEFIPRENMETELGYASNYLARLVKGKISSDQVEKLASVLKKLMHQKYATHWHSGNPDKGSSFRCITIMQG